MKKIMYIILLVFLTSIVTTTAIEPSMNSEITLTTEGNMGSVITQIAEKNIDTKLFCQAESCNYNIDGEGTVNIPDNEYITVNDNSNSNSYDINFNDRNSGFSGHVDLMDKHVNSFVKNETRDIDSTTKRFFYIMEFFVNHYIRNAQDKIFYLASEIDRLNAENRYLREYLGLVYDEGKMEEYITVEKSKRLGIEVVSPSGLHCDYWKFGNDCAGII